MLSWIDIGGVVCLVAYHLLLACLAYFHPHQSIIGMTRQARVVWIHSVVLHKQSILLIQTLRNWRVYEWVALIHRIMQATLLGMTSSSLSIGLIAFISTADIKLNEIHQYGLLRIDDLFPMKIMLVLLAFLLSFFWFSQAIRIYNHVSVLTTAACYHTSDMCGTHKEVSRHLDPHFIARLMNKGALFQTIAMRCFYMTIPLLFWLFGSVYFLLCSILMVLILLLLDVNHV